MYGAETYKGFSISNYISRAVSTYNQRDSNKPMAIRIILFLQDINECVDANDCTQTCTNFPGGRNCSCLEGFQVDPMDSTFCIRKFTTCVTEIISVAFATKYIQEC